ncbi:MAG: hypothetical protein FJ295_19380 [Planctomycetes bacterium]|nr:hypothetical protein [Planctomycetota bacterium]
MSYKTLSSAIRGLFCVLVLSGSGCVGIQNGPNLGFAGVPIPVSPFFQDKKEDEFWLQERYKRVPVLEPLTAGGPHVALDPPSDDEVMWALEKARPTEGGLPFLYSVHRNNVRIVKEKIADYVDPPRFVPLIGPAQLHHAHYKCTIYFSEVKRIGWPVPHTLRDDEVQEVVYIDHNHFHMVGNVDTH